MTALHIHAKIFSVEEYMAKLSINVNKIATLRNARGKNIPDLLTVVKDLISFGTKGITLHPRPDRRHIFYEDVIKIKEILTKHKDVEFNIEGFPSPEFLKLIEEAQPTQCTLVPDPPDALTSNAGWRFQENFDYLKNVLAFLKKKNIRSSVFLDPLTCNPTEQESIARLHPDRVELYTEAYASHYHGDQRESLTNVYLKLSHSINEQGIGINAGHDLNLENLAYLLEKIPLIQEVSIGHALICEALYLGLKKTVETYVKICEKK